MERTDSGFLTPKVNVRIVLAVLWIGHFIVWIFGDFFALMQEMGEPVEDGSIVLFVAPTTAIVQASIAAFCLVGQARLVRVVNLVVAPIYLLFNIGFMFESSHAWEYYLGVFYIIFSLLIVWFAYSWRVDDHARDATASPATLVREPDVR